MPLKLHFLENQLRIFLSHIPCYCSFENDNLIVCAGVSVTPTVSSNQLEHKAFTARLALTYLHTILNSAEHVTAATPEPTTMFLHTLLHFSLLFFCSQLPWRQGASRNGNGSEACLCRHINTTGLPAPLGSLRSWLTENLS